MDEIDRTTPAADSDRSLTRLLQVVAIAANEARSVDEALRTGIDAVCTHTAWPIGHAYLVAPVSRQLIDSDVWHLPEGERFDRLREKAASEARALEGMGPVSRALAGETVWIDDLSSDPRFSGEDEAQPVVAAGVVIPILVRREVVGVLEFYAPRNIDLEGGLLETLAQVGVQIGRAVERERAQEALRESEARSAGIISISADAIVTVNEEQRIILYNQGAEKIFGYSRDEVVGGPLEVLIPEQHRAHHHEQVRAFGEGPVAARRMGERGRITGRRKNGEIFPADASISKLEIGGKRIYTAVLRDVTDRVRAEDELARQAMELARSNADLEQFAYVASHDLQEPLRMVASYTQLLARRYRGKLDEDADEFIGFAVDGVNRMQALINDLLAYSRVGSRGDNLEATNMNELFDRVLLSLGPAIEETGATVAREDLPVIRADPGQMAQVLQNLIANAMKFRKPDVVPNVSVSARRDPEGWVFSVADNGIGIAAEYADRIFVLFQRLHSRDEYSGTGIGLAICKKIVERHGGRIWFDSEPGRGTTFHFLIPEATRSRR